MTGHEDRSTLRHLSVLYNKRNDCIYVHVYLFAIANVYLSFNCYAYLKLGVLAACQLPYVTVYIRVHVEHQSTVAVSEYFIQC